MKREVAIHQVQPQDLDILRELAISTFIDTYGEFNSEENMDNYLDTNFNREKLKEELNDPDVFYRFAKNGEEVVGYLKLNEGIAQTENILENSLEIERIYVDPKYKGQGIGAKMVVSSIGIAKARKLKSVWLGVWEKNPAAIGFYKKNGFMEFSRHVFLLGDDEQTDLMMKVDVV